MKIQYILFLSTSNLTKRKLRSVLTIGGMAVGISLIVFLISLGFGLQQLIKSQITNVEALTILDVSKGESTLLELNENVVDQFKTIDSVDDVSPSLSLSGQIGIEESVTDTAIYGIDPAFISMEGIKVNYGEVFTDDVAKEIIATQTALNLVSLSDPEAAVGQELDLKLLVPEIIEGTQEEELVSKEVKVVIKGVIIDEDELAIAYVPIKFLVGLGYSPDYSEAKVKVGDTSGEDYTLARVKVTDESQLQAVREQIEGMGYQVDSIADTVGQIDKIFLVFELVMALFGVIAMFVAAMGSLNTLTVSLLERTREIGVMKALGATSRDIYRLFLVEAIMIGMTGGIIGIIIGYLMGKGVNYGINYLAARAGGEQVTIFYTPLWFVGVVALIAFLVSVVTGLYPARRAGKINPLDALRYE
ncbi:ABC transporter permease [Patescibacteria group bacterium]|nr:ABC transporter permease [Patescibacteria group bacterium]